MPSSTNNKTPTITVLEIIELCESSDMLRPHFKSIKKHITPCDQERSFINSVEFQGWFIERAKQSGYGGWKSALAFQIIMKAYKQKKIRDRKALDSRIP
jgi:hypothetical protein